MLNEFSKQTTGILILILKELTVLIHILLSQDTYYFIHENQTWIKGPDLTTGRMAHAAQVVIDSETKEELVIVTGGLFTTENGGNYIDTSEILFDGEWVAGNDNLTFYPDKLSPKADHPFVFSKYIVPFVHCINS